MIKKTKKSTKRVRKEPAPRPHLTAAEVSQRFKISPEAWQRVKADYETSGMSVRDLAIKHDVFSKQIYYMAKKHGWVSARLLPLAEKEIEARKAIKEVEKVKREELNYYEAEAVENLIQSRLRLQGLLICMDSKLVEKGLEILEGVTTPHDWETMTRGRKNVHSEKAPQQVDSSANNTQINISQVQTSNTQVCEARAVEAWRKAMGYIDDEPQEDRE